MALPASGIISMNDIRVELGIPSQAPFDINTARSGGYVFLNPYSSSLPPSTGTVSLASWYSYCHTCNRYSHTIYWPGEVNIATSAAIACGVTDAYTVYSNCSTLNDGCKVWRDVGLWTNEPTYMSEWYKTNDGRAFQTNSSGIIYNMQNCPAGYTAYTVRLDYSTGTICGTGTSTVYTSGTWGVGTTVYSDTALTTAVTGYNYVVNVADGIIYEINVSTGYIQLDTGLTC